MTQPGSSGPFHSTADRDVPSHCTFADRNEAETLSPLMAAVALWPPIDTRRGRWL